MTLKCIASLQIILAEAAMPLIVAGVMQMEKVVLDLDSEDGTIGGLRTPDRRSEPYFETGRYPSRIQPLIKLLPGSLRTADARAA